MTASKLVIAALQDEHRETRLSVFHGQKMWLILNIYVPLSGTGKVPPHDLGHDRAS
jgi:hypothetical protein